MNEYIFEEIQIGQAETFTKKITLQMEESFREITGDLNPLHSDDGYARNIGNGKFKSHICFGMLTASLYSTLAGVYLPGKYSLIHSIDNISFRNPVFAGDILTVIGGVIAKQNDLKLIQIRSKIINHDRKIVSKADMKILVQK